MIAPALASRAVFGPTLLFLAALLLGVWLAIVTRSLWQGRDEPVRWSVGMGASKTPSNMTGIRGNSCANHTPVSDAVHRVGY